MAPSARSPLPALLLVFGILVPFTVVTREFLNYLDSRGLTNDDISIDPNDRLDFSK